MHTAGSPNQSSFARIHTPAPQRSSLPLSTTRQHTMDAGFLVPAYHEYCLPGDSWNFNVAMFGRLMTLKFPLMDNLILDWFAFFVPDRVIWDNFEKLQGFQPNPGDSVDFVFPWLIGSESNSFTVQEGNNVADYLGLPLGAIDSQVYAIRSTPWRAYRKIWNDWFRDQNYQDSLAISGDINDPTGNGPDTFEVVNTLLRRNKRPDYFSTALPAPQKGPAVALPIEGKLPVWGDGGPLRFYRQTMSEEDTYFLQSSTTGSSTTVWSSTLATPVTNMNIVQDGENGPSGLLADASAIILTVNDMRESIVMQQIYELDGRGGTRYTEALVNRWNVSAQDSRLQRAEFISSGSSHLSVSQVAQTSPTTGDNAQASLAAYSELRATGRVSYTCPEHGHLLLLVNLRAPLKYQQQLNRKHLVRTRFDSPEPLTMNLGERAVMQYEMFYPPLGPDAVWGYQEIWAEWRYSPSFVTGKFRSAASQSLDAWHLALDYESAPVHNGDWVYDDPPVDRVIEFTDEPQFKLDLLVRGVVARQMPVVSTPGVTRI